MDRPSALPSETVHAFVLAAHGDVPTVTAMLAATPALANAVWDWGGGDFESALDAAAHTGQRAIALLLLDHGARLNLPAAVMLGELELVRATLARFPDMRHATGAHGIPLLQHALAGGEPAEQVAQLLSGDRSAANS